MELLKWKYICDSIASTYLSIYLYYFSVPYQGKFSVTVQMIPVYLHEPVIKEVYACVIKSSPFKAGFGAVNNISDIQGLPKFCCAPVQLAIALLAHSPKWKYTMQLLYVLWLNRLLGKECAR